MARAVEIHCFSDASKQAYGATLYLRILTDARASVSLQLAKSKVAPLKILSIPRLELAAFHLASKLTKQYFQRTKLPITAHLWTDYLNVLFWLRKPLQSWKVFVWEKGCPANDLIDETLW